MGTIDIPAYRASSNDGPSDDFDGLTPRQMHLSYDPCSEVPLLKLRDSIDESTLNAVPSFRMSGREE